MTINDRALAALQRIVDNGDEPVGGTLVTMSYDPDAGTYYAGVSAGELDASVQGPVLLHVLLGIGMVEECEHVTLGPDGSVLCSECDGDGCDECTDGVPRHVYFGGHSSVFDGRRDVYPEWTRIALWGFEHCEMDDALERWASDSLVSMGLLYHPEPCSTMMTERGEMVMRGGPILDKDDEHGARLVRRLLLMADGSPGSYVHLESAHVIATQQGSSWDSVRSTIRRGVDATRAPGTHSDRVANHWARESLLRLAAIE